MRNEATNATAATAPDRLFASWTSTRFSLVRSSPSMLCRNLQRISSNLARGQLMAPNSRDRITMVKNHLSTFPSPTTQSADAPVLFEAVHSLRKVILNRPKVHNALNAEMVDLIQPQLQQWEDSPLASIILFKGIGKSFCAGGDVVSLVKQLDDPAEWHKSSEFFSKEYSTDAFIAKMKTPVVSFISGNTMGGGVGLAVHATFKVASETTRIAMPETKIGLFPDVGASFFLSRLDGGLGIYLGLTSTQIAGAGAFFSGFATHYVPAERLSALEARLAEVDDKASPEAINSVIEEYSADEAELAKGLEAYPLKGAVRRAVDHVFAGKKSVVEMMASLSEIEGESDLIKKKILVAGEEEQAAAVRAWATKTIQEIEERSPTSCVLTVEAIREGKKLNIDEAFRMDMRIATACCNPEVHPDFKVGVTALLIEKSKKRTDWKPSTIAEVSLADVRSNFFSNPPPFSSPPVPPLAITHASAPYKAYPHANFALPSESYIQDFVTGDAKGSGSYALTEKELLKKVTSHWGSKLGVKEKVKEVVARKCTVVDGETLKWTY